MCEAAWERRLAGWDGGGCLTSGQGEMHLSPSNPRAASSGVPRYHLHVPAPPHLRVFKRPWFGQLLKHKEVLERRTRGGVGGGAQARGPAWPCLQVSSPGERLAGSLASGVPREEKEL